MTKLQHLQFETGHCDLFIVQANIISREALRSVEGNNLGAIQNKLEKASVYYDLIDHQDGSNHGVPSLEYEELRRRLRNDIQETW